MVITGAGRAAGPAAGDSVWPKAATEKAVKIASAKVGRMVRMFPPFLSAHIPGMIA
jgi:hypothetical protein